VAHQDEIDACLPQFVYQDEHFATGQSKHPIDPRSSDATSDSGGNGGGHGGLV
jgi:hypothetical protein